MNYLGKRKVYKMAVDMLQYADMPKCKECYYTFANGYEWLVFSLPGREVRFTVLNQGIWVKVVEWDGYQEVYRNDVLKSIDPRLSWKLA